MEVVDHYPRVRIILPSIGIDIHLVEATRGMSVRVCVEISLNVGMFASIIIGSM